MLSNQDNSIYKYQQSTEYSNLNKFLRDISNLKKFMSDNPNEKYTKLIQNLDNKIQNTGNYTNTYLYRGISGGIIPAIMELTSGVLVNKAYTSTTKNLDTAKKFVSDDGCCILMFTIPEDIKYLEMPNQNWEQEILLQRNTQFIIDIQNSKHPIYKATLTKWNPPHTQTDSKEKNIIKTIADIMSEECKKLGKENFYKKRLKTWIENLDEDESLFEAELYASDDVDKYCD